MLMNSKEWKIIILSDNCAVQKTYIIKHLNKRKKYQRMTECQ